MTLLDTQCYSYPRKLSPTAALLLDVENFCLKIDLEQYIKAYCAYPITIKLAVANWQNSTISNFDLYLHQQRYQLIHVPKEKNAADAQVLTLGTSLLLQYPQIKEIVIVSRDSIFDYLHQSLASLGCNTYKVYQESSNIYIHNFLNNRTDCKTIPSNTIQQKSQKNIKNQTFDQDTKKILQDKILLIINKLTKSSNDEITVNSVTQEYKKYYKKSLSKVIKSNKLGSSVIKFLKNNCVDKIDVNQKNNVYHISLK